jgi:hypothetical protein
VEGRAAEAHVEAKTAVGKAAKAVDGAKTRLAKAKAVRAEETPGAGTKRKLSAGEKELRAAERVLKKAAKDAADAKTVQEEAGHALAKAKEEERAPAATHESTKTSAGQKAAPTKKRTPSDEGTGASGANAATLKALRAKAKGLRKAAVADPAAVDELRDLYKAQSDSMLRKMKKDPVAAAELDKRESTNPKFEKARASKRMPHEATVVVEDVAGKQSTPKQVKSGGVTPEEMEQHGENEANLRSHTEAKAIREIPLEPGQTMRIEGQYDPCMSCQRRMRAAATESGATIIYWWPGGPRGGMRFIPAVKPKGK